MTVQPIPTHLSPTKRVVFSIVTLACVAGLIELTALVAYRGLAGRWHDPGESASWRTGLAPPAEGQVPSAPLPPYLVGDVIHPYVGFVIDPSQSPVSRFGFPSDPLARSDQALQIAVFGGSVAGMTAQVIANVLPEFLEQRGLGPVRVDVLNLGLGGGKQPQQMLALAYLQSLGARFDVVVNIDGFNEIVLPVAENAAVGVYPFYPRGWKERVGPLADAPTLAHLGRLSMYSEARRRLAQSLDDSFLRRSASRHELQRESAEVWLRSSMEMNALARAAGAQYFHFLQPSQYLRDSKPLTAQERRDAYRPKGAYGFAAEEGYPLLVAAGSRLHEAGIAFTDLTQIFTQDTRTLYIDDCCHLGPEGTLLLAQAIAERVAKGMARARDGGPPSRVPNRP